MSESIDAAPAAPTPASTPSPAAMTSAQALEAIAASPLDAAFSAALTDASHPAHAAAVARQTALYAAAYPEPSNVQPKAVNDDDPLRRGHVSLSAVEAEAKVSNTIGFPAGTAPVEAQELRQGAALAIESLGLSHHEAGHALLELNAALRRPGSQTEAETEAELRREFRSGYDEVIGFARLAVEHLETVRPGTRQFLEESNLGNSPIMVRIFARAGQRMALRKKSR